MIMKNWKKIGLNIEMNFYLMKYLDYVKERKDEEDERKRDIKRNGRKDRKKR